MKKSYANQPITIKGAVVGGIIAGIFTIIGAIITIIPNYVASTQEPIATITSIAASNTSSTISTITANPTVELQKPNCLSVQKWTPYSEISNYQVKGKLLTPVPQTECWYLYDWGIYFKDEVLEFVGADAIDYGFFGVATPISLNSSVEANISIKSMGWASKIIIALVDEKPARLGSDGVYWEFWNGGSYGYFLKLYRLSQGKEGPSIYIDNPIALRNEISVKFDIKDALLSVTTNDLLLNNKPENVVFQNPTLLIGYQIDNLSNDISAEFTNLHIETK